MFYIYIYLENIKHVSFFIAWDRIEMLKNDLKISHQNKIIKVKSKFSEAIKHLISEHIHTHNHTHKQTLIAIINNKT